MHGRIVSEQQRALLLFRYLGAGSSTIQVGTAWHRKKPNEVNRGGSTIILEMLTSAPGIFPVLCFICVVSVKYRRDCRECWAHHKKYSGGKGFTPAFTGRSIPPPPPRPYVTQHNKISGGGSISGGISGEF